MDGCWGLVLVLSNQYYIDRNKRAVLPLDIIFEFEGEAGHRK